MKTTTASFVLLVVLTAGYVSAEPDASRGISPFSLSIAPSLGIPIGESSNLFGIAGGGDILANLRLPFLPLVYVGAGLGYTFHSVQNSTSAAESLSKAAGGAVLGLQLSLAPRLEAKGYVRSGGEFIFLNDLATFVSGWGAYLRAGIGLTYLIQPTFGLGIDVSYIYSFGLFHGIEISLVSDLRFANTPRVQPALKTQPLARPESLDIGPAANQEEGLEIESISFQNIFPVFHKYYDDHPIGRVTFRNRAPDSATNLKMSLEIKPYMTAPKEIAFSQEIKAGESREIDLYALFSEDKILDVTEGTKASAEISWEYTLKGQRYAKKKVETVRLLNRNAMTWEDDRSAAAFVTSLDPAVLTFSKNVAGIAKGTRGTAMNPNLLMGIALYVALGQYGMTYAVDPKSPYSESVKKRSEVDFLQFPRQTLEYRAGDCDDLSILYSALFESAGIETAFLTIPGHIFMAFSLGIKPDEARKTFQRPDDLIVWDGVVWLPLEVTVFGGKFLDAWQMGAKEWRENVAKQQAALYPVHEAWKEYESVGFASGTFQVSVPPRDKVSVAYQQEVETFVEREISMEVAKLQAEIQKQPDAVQAMNRLGVLYAKYGLLDRAERQFSEVLQKEEYAPTLMNLGNISFLRKDMTRAKDYYERAYAKKPDDPKVVLNVARVNHEMENYGIVRELYAKLKTLDSTLADQFAYLDLRGEEATRASEMSGAREVIIWSEN